MRRLRTALLWWIDSVAAHPWLVVLAAALLAVASLWYTLGHLRLDTDTTAGKWADGTKRFADVNASSGRGSGPPR